MPIYVPGKVTLAKEFTPQIYMYEFPSQYPVWTPADITTALWLDAADASTITESGGAVSQWDDKSGNGRNATATGAQQPTYSSILFDGNPGITFNGASNYFLLPNDAAPSGNNAIFSVLKTDASGTVGGLINREYYFGGWKMRFTSSSQLTYTSETSVTTSGVLNNTKHICEGFYDGTNISVLLDGGAITSTAQTGGIAYDSRDITTIGSSAATGAATINYIECVLAEIVVIHFAPTVDIRRKIEGYLAHKWGLTANLPSDHPYKLVGPTP